MNRSFPEICESAAASWAVPALAVATAAGDDVSVSAVGCDPDALFRVASVTKPFTALLALGLLDLVETTGVWPADVEIRHLLSHTSGFDCELPERDLARFGGGDGALAAVVDELPATRRFLGVEQVWSYANTG
jgi:CubicO group peptidase (beta-lactamase class C family)